MAIKTKKQLCFFKLIILNQNNSSSHIFYSSTKSITIGRATSNEDHFSIESNRISTIHAKIIFVNGSFTIKCLSKNGLFVDNTLLSHKNESFLLRSGSLIQISDNLIYFFLLTPARRLDKCTFEKFKRLKRLKDPLVDLKKTTAFVNTKNLIKTGAGEIEELVFHSLDVKIITKESFEVFLKAFDSLGFFNWGKIDQILKSKGFQAYGETACSVSGLTVISELARQAFMCGKLNAAKKLAAISRTEMTESTVLDSLSSRYINCLAKETLEYSDNLANLIIVKYYLNLFLKRYDENDLQKIKSLPNVEGWNFQNDMDLLRGTSVYGLNSFDRIEKDPKLSVQKSIVFLSKNYLAENKKEPKNNNILLKSRFEILIEAIMLKIYNSGSFSRKRKCDEWNLTEHFDLLHILQTFGNPKCEDDWEKIKRKNKNLFERKNMDQIKHRCASFIETLEKVVSKKSPDSEQNEFCITLKGAINLKTRFNFISDLKEKVQKLDSSLINRLTKFEYKNKLPGWWNKPEFDRDLLIGVLKHGIGEWLTIKTDPELIFNPFPMRSFRNFEPFIFERVVKLVVHLQVDSVPKIKTFMEYKNNFSASDPSQKKTNSLPSNHISKQFSRSSMNPNRGHSQFISKPNMNTKPHAPNNMEKSTFNPIMLNQSLLLINPGVIEYKRQGFHTSNSIFPLGFKTIRKYISCVNPAQNCKYSNEIVDGGTQPVFQVRCEHNPNFVIRQLNPTSAWEIINEKIKLLNCNKKTIKSINGFERFGLMEPSIINLIDNLPNAEKCLHYKRKQIPSISHSNFHPDISRNVPPPPRE